jgi:hypothetical protein
MAGGTKPAAKIAIKPASGGDRVYIAAAWRRPDGRMGGLMLDRRVTQLAVQLDDGTVVRVKRGDDGKMTHYIDLFLEDGAPRSAPQPRATQRAEEPAADFGDDELPF